MTEMSNSAKTKGQPSGPVGIVSPDGTGLPEADLVRLAPGDPDAFAALYRRHAPAIQRYLKGRLGDAHLVEDAVAETFVSALKQIHRYQERGLPFRAWLYRIATGAATRHYKQASRLAMASLEHDPEARRKPDPDDADQARTALLRIPARFQSVLALHYFEELSVEQIATTLNCRAGTVKSRLSRGRDALRVQLIKMGVSS